MPAPILYYWGPCTVCATTVKFAEENGIELDKRDVEQVPPYEELLALGGDANKIPYLYDDGELLQGNTAIIEHLTAKFIS